MQKTQEKPQKDSVFVLPKENAKPAAVLAAEQLKIDPPRYVEPHRKVSRPVTVADLPLVIRLAPLLQALCVMGRGLHRGAYALAHAQVEENDPLRFFVTADGMIICNARLTRHTKVGTFREEGCMSFPDEHVTMTKRFNKIEVQYQTIDNGELTAPITVPLKGLQAQIFQHELGHFDAEYVYPLPEVSVPSGVV